MRQRAVKNVVDQRRFAAAGNAGDHDEAAQRKFDRDVLQIVLARAVHDQFLAVAVAASGGRFDPDRAGKILAGERSGISFDFARSAGGHQLPAQAAGAGSEIDHVIGALDGFGIVLHHQHRVAEIAQTRERIEQAVVIARVQPDGRLVQNIQHAAKLGADLRRQADALRFAARKRGGGTRQAQVIETDGGEKLQAVADLFDDARRRSAARAR